MLGLGAPDRRGGERPSRCFHPTALAHWMGPATTRRECRPGLSAEAALTNRRAEAAVQPRQPRRSLTSLIGLGITPRQAWPACSGSHVRAKASTTATPLRATGRSSGTGSQAGIMWMRSGGAIPDRAHQPVVGSADPASGRARWGGSCLWSHRGCLAASPTRCRRNRSDTAISPDRSDSTRETSRVLRGPLARQMLRAPTTDRHRSQRRDGGKY